jgi:hypothetical protein
MESATWQFVQVDPLAPKKRRKRRNPEPGQPKRTRLDSNLPDVHQPHPHWTGRLVPTSAEVGTLFESFSRRQPATATHDTCPQHPKDGARSEERESLESDFGTPAEMLCGFDGTLDRSQLDDFDRYCLYANGTTYQNPTASTVWCSLGVNIFFMWTPLATSMIENSLFHYCTSHTSSLELTR